MTLGLGEDREVQAFSVVNGGEFSRIGHSAVSTRTKSMTFGFGSEKKKPAVYRLLLLLMVASSDVSTTLLF